MISSMSFRFASTALILAGFLSTARTQTTAQRPTSDSASTPQGSAGTNYLRESAGSQTASSAAQKAAVANQANAAAQRNSTTLANILLSQPENPIGTHAVRPTSDQANKRPLTRAGLLMNGVSSAAIAKPEAVRAFTNYSVIRPDVDPSQYAVSTPIGSTPAMVRAIYGVNKNGGSGVIAIVDAYHYPSVVADLATFSGAFQLPVLAACAVGSSFAGAPCIKVEARADSHVDCGWDQEAALDVQWAHAIAPNASILFVEAKSNSNEDLYAAVAQARDELLTVQGERELSMSWGTSSETMADMTYSSVFKDGVLYFAATGDSGGQVGEPAAFPNVVAVGGTIAVYNTNSQFVTEIGWPDSGGGVSEYEPLPPYQHGMTNILGATRNLPDIAAVSDANPAVAVYISTPFSDCVDRPSSDQYSPGWTQLSGTSLSTPLVAAMVNFSGKGRAVVNDELQAIYANAANPSRIRDITYIDSPAGGNRTLVGYDRVTGVGSPASMDFDTAPPH